MTNKQPILPDRIRKVPQQFSWVDGRLVRDRRIDGCSHAASALYLFLVTVADTQGLSYYSDSTISKRLTMDSTLLATVRMELIQCALIAYSKPLYQVLDLAPMTSTVVDQRNQPGDVPQSLGQIIRKVMEVQG
jgi:hypothetical protein